MPVPVDSKYINPAYLPLKQSLTFPPVNSTGFMLGWGQNNVNSSITTQNRYLQKVELTSSSVLAAPCKDLYTITATDAPYSVI